VKLLAQHSPPCRGLCFAGAVDRLRQLLAKSRTVPIVEDRPGERALFCLPDEDEQAVEISECCCRSVPTRPP